jgi:hypothetical protein
MMLGDKKPLAVVTAEHFGDFVVKVTFSDDSIACMTVGQYDALLDHGADPHGERNA